MNSQPSDPLLLIGKILTFIMQAIMGVSAAALLVSPVVLLVMLDEINAELAAKLEGAAEPLPIASIFGGIALGLGAVVLVFVFFGKLRAIISTVGEGDPFVPANADRLHVMAWLMLAVQIITLALSGLMMRLIEWIGTIDPTKANINPSLDLTGLIMVVVLFILARVFRHGAAMRDDLEGTV